jgi:hypothetical protein
VLRQRQLVEDLCDVHICDREWLAPVVSKFERTIDYLCLLLPDTANSVNLHCAEGRFSVDLCIECDFAGGFQLLDIEISALNPNLIAVWGGSFGLDQGRQRGRSQFWTFA